MISDTTCRNITRVLAAAVFLVMAAGLTSGESKPKQKESPPVPQAAVTVNGKPLFTVPGVLSFPAEAAPPP